MKRFFVYRNLRTGTFSLKQGNKVIAHPEQIILHNVKFVVSKLGRQRVLAERRKNVHATLQAEGISTVPNGMIFDKSKCIEVYYNPYKTQTFIELKTGVAVYTARTVIASRNKIYIQER